MCFCRARRSRSVPKPRRCCLRPRARTISTTPSGPRWIRGHWVVCDRFADSTRVYQGVLGHVDPRLIRRLEKITVGDTKPDLTIVLDAPAETGLARAEARRGDAQTDRFESEDLAFHNRLREAYRQLAISEPDRCVLIDASEPQERVTEKVWAVGQSQARSGDRAVGDRGDGAMSPQRAKPRTTTTFRIRAHTAGSVRA